MPEAPLTPEEVRARLAAYTPDAEKTIRDFQARLGEDATRPAVNAFFRERLSGRFFRRAADLGCNNGTFAAEVIAPVCARLVLADFSEAALAAARARLGEDRVEAALRADLARETERIRTLGSFDLVSLCEVIQHMPEERDREEVFRTAAGLLEPGGILLHSGYGAREGAATEGFFRSDRFPELLYFHRSSAEAFEARFERAGLEVLHRFREERTDAFVLRRSR